MDAYDKIEIKCVLFRLIGYTQKSCPMLEPFLTRHVYFLEMSIVRCHFLVTLLAKKY